MVDQYFRKVDVFRPAALAENEGFLVVRPPAQNAPPAASSTGNATPVENPPPAEKAPSEPKVQ